ncbi:MAG: Triose-phosphate Transporter [Peltula sp. TS41687]|nr:MAG: Triose-phosphate Transporter [Peltula sp. TS41687]
MDEAAQGHRRRRSSLMEGKIPDGNAPAHARKEKSGSRKHRQGYDNARREYNPGNNQELDPEFSSCSTSDDVELEDVPSDEGLEADEETGLTKSERRRRKMRRRKNSRMDSRVMRESTEIQRQLADKAVLRRSLVNGVLIGLWYLFSLSISIYNKWMFSKDHLDFHFPLFTTCVHMLVQFSLAATVLYFIPRFRPRHNFPPPDNIDDMETTRPTDSQKPLMTKKFYITRIGPCGAATGLDIGLGNMSLKFISLTFYTMCKSSALGFVLIFAFLFRLESPSIKLVLIILTMTIGVIMMVAGETAFNALGFILIIAAAFFSGFRWALTQILLLRNPATSNPFSSIFYLAPIMFLSLLIIAVPVEGVSELADRTAELVANKGIFLGPAILLFPGLLAFLMTSSEFALLQRTSVVTLSICGIFKEVVTIVAAGIVFHDDLTPINLSGLAVTISSIAAYNYLKIRKMRNDAMKDVQLLNTTTAQGDYVPVDGSAGHVVEEEDDRSSVEEHMTSAAAANSQPLNSSSSTRNSLSLNVAGEKSSASAPAETLPVVDLGIETQLPAPSSSSSSSPSVAAAAAEAEAAAATESPKNLKSS